MARIREIFVSSQGRQAARSKTRRKTPGKLGRKGRRMNERGKREARAEGETRLMTAESRGADTFRSGRHGIHPERDANYGLTKYCSRRATAYVANNKRPVFEMSARDGNKYPPVTTITFYLAEIGKRGGIRYKNCHSSLACLSPCARVRYIALRAARIFRIDVHLFTRSTVQAGVFG